MTAPNGAPAPPRDTHFGFRTVGVDHKQSMVDEVFDQVAPRYDLMNDLMSGGLHWVGKDILVTALNPPRNERALPALAVAGATGDVASRIAEAAGASTRVTVCDINEEMLAVGRERAAHRRLEGRVSFTAGNAETLPFPDRNFDACTVAFGIRNVPRIDIALGEFFRVLRPGSRFLCLEFSSVDVPGLDALYDFYSFNVIPALGRAVAGDAEAYRYLVESIRRFPKPAAFAEMITAAGVRRGNFRALSGGGVAVDSGWRLWAGALPELCHS